MKEDGKNLNLHVSGYNLALTANKCGYDAIVNPSENSSKLHVNFYHLKTIDYWVMEARKEYLLIGSENRRHAWILSRTPLMDEKLKKDIVRELELNGFDTKKLIFIDHY